MSGRAEVLGCLLKARLLRCCQVPGELSDSLVEFFLLGRTGNRAGQPLRVKGKSNKFDRDASFSAFTSSG